MGCSLDFLRSIIQHNKYKMTNWKRLMANHILSAKKVVESKLVKRKSESKKLLKKGLDGLTKNTREWKDAMTLVFQNPETGRHYGRLWAEHVMLEGKYIGAAFACPCGAKDFGMCHKAGKARKSVQDLRKNGAKLVSFLTKHFGNRKQWEHLWAEHLQCVKDFIDLGKETACGHATRAQFNARVKHCIKISENYAGAVRKATNKLKKGKK